MLDEPPPPTARPRASFAGAELPVRRRYPILAGALLGVAIRLAFFGSEAARTSPMSVYFIVGAPFLVGMATVYLAERERRRTWRYHAVAPILSTALFVAGTLAILIEGLICGLFILPLFVAIGMAGGLFMGAVCRFTNWPRPTLLAALVAPFAGAAFGPTSPMPTAFDTFERSVWVAAPAPVVWRQLHQLDAIRPAEMASAWAMRIGVPAPMSGATRPTADGLVRESRWGKSVHFDEVIVDWQPERFVRWTYRFAADSFPAHALDEHVRIGGPHFDLVDTAFTLEPDSGGTRLTTRVRYRIATGFNAYAVPAGRFVLANLSEAGLALYKARSERAASPELDTVAGR